MKTISVTRAVLMIVLFGVAVSHPASKTGGTQSVEPVPLPIWERETLATGVHVYTLSAPALALDPAGRPHVVFGSNALFHAWFDGARWQRETVDDIRPSWSEAVIAIDGAGRVIIADIEDGRVNLRERGPGGSWQVTPLPLPAGLGELTIALDRGGRPLVAAGFATYNETPVFYLAREGATGWTTEAVPTASPAGGPLRLALDGADRPAVLYAQSGLGELWLARRGATGWQHAKIASGCLIVGKSLALDAAGNAHAAFSEHCDRKLTYTRESASGWELIPVAADGVYPSLAVDAAGRPQLVFGDYEVGQFYATLSDSRWVTTRIQEGEYAGWYNTLALDKAGTAHIIALNGDLYYATNPNETWQVNRVAANLWVGRHNSLGLDSADTPYMLYDKSQAGELWWGMGRGDSWTTGLLADVTADALDVAVAVDARDRPHIAFVDRAANRLVVGQRQGGEWATETIGPGGYDLSLVVGDDNRPQLILTSGGGIAYWTRAGEEWVSEPVANLSGVWGAWLALDSRNRPHVASMGSGGPRHAVRLSPGNWIVEPLGFEDVVGLALGPDDELYVFHTTTRSEGGKPPTTFTTLWLAIQESEDTWVDFPLAEEASWWEINTRLVVDADKRAHMIFSPPYVGVVYQWLDPSGAGETEHLPWAGGGDISLSLGKDGQPRVLASDGSNLALGTRRVLRLDKAAFLPITAR